MLSIRNNIRIGTVQQGALSSLLASSETITADSQKVIFADGVTMTIKQWFDQINDEFTELYSLSH